MAIVPIKPLVYLPGTTTEAFTFSNNLFWRVFGFMPVALINFESAFRSNLITMRSHHLKA